VTDVTAKPVIAPLRISSSPLSAPTVVPAVGVKVTST